MILRSKASMFFRLTGQLLSWQLLQKATAIYGNLAMATSLLQRGRISHSDHSHQMTGCLQIKQHLSASKMPGRTFVIKRLKCQLRKARSWCSQPMATAIHLKTMTASFRLLQTYRRLFRKMASAILKKTLNHGWPRHRRQAAAMTLPPHSFFAIMMIRFQNLQLKNNSPHFLKIRHNQEEL